MGPPSLRDRRIRSPVARSGKMADRASNAPQGMRERKTGAAILEKMPGHEWLSCTSISRLIGANDDRKTRARLDRLVLAESSASGRGESTVSFISTAS